MPTQLIGIGLAVLLPGVLQAQGAPGHRFVRGDTSNDNVLSVADAILVLQYLFQGAEEPSCEDAADVDDSGTLDLTDGIYVVLMRFAARGPPPPPPFPGCGTDPTEDLLGCADYSGCEPLPEFKNSVGISFVLIPPGTYSRGSPEGERGRDLDGFTEGTAPPRAPDEHQHRVRITCAFHMSATEVTQGQYRAVMGRNPSQGEIHPDRAVCWLTWQEAVDFCEKLTEIEGLAGQARKYRLPTEAEWEYACRAGTTTRYWFGDALECNDFGEPSCPTFDRHMWYNGHLHRRNPTPVGVKPPNPWGLHDMHGGVGEWCQDWYGPYPAERSPELIDPSGPRTGTRKVLRGLATNNPHWGRSAARVHEEPRSFGQNIGFRVVFGGCPAPPHTVP